MQTEPFRILRAFRCRSVCHHQNHPRHTAHSTSSASCCICLSSVISTEKSIDTCTQRQLYAQAHNDTQIEVCRKRQSDLTCQRAKEPHMCVPSRPLRVVKTAHDHLCTCNTSYLLPASLTKCSLPGCPKVFTTSLMYDLTGCGPTTASGRLWTMTAGWS